MVESQRADICPELKCCKWNEIIKIPTCLLLDRFQSQTVLFCVVRVCPMVSVRGKTPIPMTLWGYSRHARGQQAVRTLPRWSMCRWGNSILPLTWHRREPKQPGWSPTSPFPQQYSQVPHLSICGHVSIRLEKGGVEIILQISTKSFLCRLV